MAEQMRCTLAVIKYLVKGQFGRQIGYRTACGRIGSHEAEGGLPPRLVIDGQEIPWARLGRMPMTFDGCQFRIETRGRGEEL